MLENEWLTTLLRTYINPNKGLPRLAFLKHASTISHVQTQSEKEVQTRTGTFGASPSAGEALEGKGLTTQNYEIWCDSPGASLPSGWMLLSKKVSAYFPS